MWCLLTALLGSLSGREEPGAHHQHLAEYGKLSQGFSPLWTALGLSHTATSMFAARSSLCSFAVRVWLCIHLVGQSPARTNQYRTDCGVNEASGTHWGCERSRSVVTVFIPNAR